MVTQTLRRALAALAVLAVALSVSSGSRASAAAPDAALQDRINAAVEKGVKWLRAQQRSTAVDPKNNFDGGFGAVEVNNQSTYQMGLAALAGLAMLASGVPRDDPAIKAATEFLKKRDEAEVRGSSRSVYGVGLLLMFLTEVHRGKPKPEGRYATAKAKDPCNLSKEVKEWVQDLANWMVAAQIEPGLWRYPHSPPADLSNSQYALLGLRAARDCGAEVSPAKFLLALNATLSLQQKDGAKMQRVIPATKPGERDYAIGSPDRARGWGYQGETSENGASGSMTTAGIAALAICRDALMKPTRSSAYPEDLDHKVAQSVQDGFAWLDKNFTVTKNPGNGAPDWLYYYLYGLERAGALAGREFIGKHDWYIEGAKFLVDHQSDEGYWRAEVQAIKEVGNNDVCETSWAILFLKKATRPTIPVKEPVVTQSDDPPPKAPPPSPPPPPSKEPPGMSSDK